MYMQVVSMWMFVNFSVQRKAFSANGKAFSVETEAAALRRDI